MIKARFLTLFLLPVISFLCIEANAHAEWLLVNDASSLHFISTKKGAVAEVHHFKNISGQVNDSGEVTVSIDLNSVDTAVEVRDQRLRELLFETAEYSTASLTTTVNMEGLKSAEIGGLLSQPVKAELSLHGKSKPLEVMLSVVKLSPEKILVISQKPVIINAGDFELIPGVEKLMEIVNLPSISTAIPVTFSFVFEAHTH